MNKRQIDRLDFESKLSDYEKTYGPIGGLLNSKSRQVFIEQLIDSRHRIEYVHTIKKRAVSPKRYDPTQKQFFDPLLGAAGQISLGNIEEACWLVFLFTHFGRGHRGGWTYAREFYGKLGAGLWDWKTVQHSPKTVELWANKNSSKLKSTNGSFGNHRKYQSLDAVGATIVSYVDWASPSHLDLFNSALAATHHDPGKAFDFLYRSMDEVQNFGRMAKFDYLTMIGKLGIIKIEPNKAYIAGSTGPKNGSRDFFSDPTLTSQQIEALLKNLDRYLEVGMQALEDSICNWQKDTTNYTLYRI